MKNKKRKPNLTIRTWKLGPFNTQSVKLYSEGHEASPPKPPTQAQQIAQDLITRTVLPKPLREAQSLPRWRRKKDDVPRSR